MRHSIKQGVTFLGSLGERGRTLAEVSAMVGVMGTLVAIAAPISINLRQGYAARGASQEIFLTLQKARMSAVAENHRFNVKIVDSTHYTIHDDTNSNGVVDTGETVTSLDITDNGSGVTLSPAVTTITFAPDATAPVYGNITVQDAGITRAIQVSRGGRVKIV